MKPTGTQIEMARRKAVDLFAKAKQRDDAALKDRRKAETADAAKTARLRALRLAKEAADEEAAAQRRAKNPRKRASAAVPSGPGEPEGK